MKVAYILLPLGLVLSLAYALDQNSDGISDVYAFHYGLSAGSGAEDPDGDGDNNAKESAFGTDPFDNTSRQTVSQNIIGSLYDFSIPTLIGKRYQFQGSSDLLPGWMDIDIPFEGTDETEHLLTSLPIAGTDKFFWRVASLSEPDFDGDSLGAFEEILLSTLDTEDDSDGDKVDDIIEFLNGLNPDSHLDADNDGLSDDWEVISGTDPNDDGSTNPDNGPDGDINGDGVSNQEAYNKGVNGSANIGPTNLQIGEIDGGIALSFRTEYGGYPADLYDSVSIVGWEAVIGDYIEIWDEDPEGLFDTFIELQSHWDADGVEQEFDMLPESQLSFILAYKGRYDEYDYAGNVKNAFSIKVEGASEVLVNGVATQPDGSSLSHSFMSDDDPDADPLPYENWSFASITITADDDSNTNSDGAVEMTLSLVPDELTDDYGQEVTYGGFVQLLKVEIGSQAEEAYKNKYVYRGDPLWNWAQNSRDLDNAYTGQTNDIASHPTLGDYVHYKAYHPGLDSSLVTNYKWSAVPAGGYTNLTTIDGPDDSSASEWKIEDGGVDWKSGIYEITLELTLSGGATATVTKEQTVWQRTDDVLVVGYIDSEDFPNIPDGATSQPVLADGTVSPVTMEDHLSPLNRTGFFGQVYIGVYKTVFKPDAARHYLNRFILQETANADPPSNFQLQLSNGVFVYDEVEINNFFSNNLNYRAINRLQAEYLLDESGEILAGPNVITKIAYQTNVGNTPDFPWVLESFADLVPFDWVDSSSEPEIHPDSGVFNFDDSTYDFYHVEHSIGVPQGFAQYVSGRVGAKGQGMNLKINGRETPWIYGLIEFKGDVYGPEYSEIIRQIFPTYWIYVNGERVNNFPQSDPELFIQLGNSL